MKASPSKVAPTRAVAGSLLQPLSKEPLISISLGVSHPTANTAPTTSLQIP